MEALLMTRLVMPDSACREIDIQGAQIGRTHRYSPGQDATVEVTNPQHERALRDAGCFPANLGGHTTRGGYTCSTCGFRGYFKRCSRCQHQED